MEIESGFIAQEVEQAALAVGYKFDGVNSPDNETDHYSMSYSTFVVPLVKSVQELSKENEELKNENVKLKDMLLLMDQRIKVLEGK